MQTAALHVFVAGLLAGALCAAEAPAQNRPAILRLGPPLIRLGDADGDAALRSELALRLDCRIRHLALHRVSVVSTYSVRGNRVAGVSLDADGVEYIDVRALSASAAAPWCS